MRATATFTGFDAFDAPQGWITALGILATTAASVLVAVALLAQAFVAPASGAGPLPWDAPTGPGRVPVHTTEPGPPEASGESNGVRPGLPGFTR